jgi:hypothetical protein
MDGASACIPRAFDDESKAAFLDFLRGHPDNRRVSSAERAQIIEWLAGGTSRPTSQREFSRRNYVKRTFAWDEGSQNLVAVGKNNNEHRVVIVLESIADVVETIHIRNNHLGWDATWRDVSSAYYGILQSDVIFLLKRCHVCAHNLSKRAKNPGNDESLKGKVEQEAFKEQDVLEKAEEEIAQEVGRDSRNGV